VQGPKRSRIGVEELSTNATFKGTGDPGSNLEFFGGAVEVDAELNLYGLVGLNLSKWFACRPVGNVQFQEQTTRAEITDRPFDDARTGTNQRDAEVERLTSVISAFHGKRDSTLLAAVLTENLAMGAPWALCKTVRDILCFMTLVSPSAARKNALYSLLTAGG